jgi:5-formyltetrahydrofolate cyclo-ligase
MTQNNPKPLMRRELRQVLANMSDAERKIKSQAACALVAASPEFVSANSIMLFLSMPHELDTSALALRCWQTGKTVVVPKVSWGQRRMLPVEITSLAAGLTTSGLGVREPAQGSAFLVNLIDLVIVPGLGFTGDGHRIGRGMGFYDRFLAQPEFVGLSCGLCFEEQVVDEVPVLDHDMPLSMLATDKGIRRFAPHCIHQ